MNNRREILMNFNYKYGSSFKYVHEKSHKIYLNDMLLFSLDDRNIEILNSLKSIKKLDYERDLVENIIIPASEKCKYLDMDEHHKKCLYVLAFVYMMKFARYS